ncbi:MAG: CTP synthase, partial [Clostridia bacterium]|nr:CTP synthase [Clostridia bacterium]
QHGEVFVTDDGAETDLDLGHYERFIDEDLNKYSNLTSGKIFYKVLEKERKGEYLGETVQIIPHVTDETKNYIKKSARHTGADVLITEIGGTIGDIESQHFLEAIRQFSLEVGRKNCLFIHVCLVPYVSGSDEYKSKPTQHSVKELQALGIRPDIIVTRSDGDVGEAVRRKIALFCNVKPDCVISDVTMDCLYETPLMLHANGLDKVVARELKLKGRPDLSEWRSLVKKIRARKKSVDIALVGKYVTLHDSYLSVVEALYAAGYDLGAKINIKWIDSDELCESNADEKLSGVDGILVPGGFGSRGTEGMITACRYAREKGLPYFGICLGMQIMVMEFARNVCGLKGATSGEFDNDAEYKVIDLMPEQAAIMKKGGTMRLGSYPCKIADGTMMKKAYGADDIAERHRHRYEFNNEYKKTLTDNGLIVSGTSPDGVIVETVELDKKYFFLGVQFHPEFKSRPNRPHPLFRSFIKDAVSKRSNV